MRIRPINLAIPVLLLSLLGGCLNYYDYGHTARYDFFYAPKVDVVMPRNAPSISQQFRVFPDGDPRGNDEGNHNGIDVRDAVGVPVLAAAPGVVVQSFYEPGYGNRIVIEHGTDSDGRKMRTVYLHLQRRLLDKGAVVARGQQIATLGSSGALAGLPHLHFELRKELTPGHFDPIDPQFFWVEGPGRVTCFVPGVEIAQTPVRLTYPVNCR